MAGVRADRAVAVLSFDVEDWFQVENLRGAIPRETWNQKALRVERNTDRLLELLANAPRKPRSTFFVLGWVAERCPDLVRRIAAAGHEIASHGYGHDLLDSLTEDSFRSDVERSKHVLEDLSGREVRGYRAPSFSITDWAIPVLQEAGFAYDSSFFPSLGHDRYGALTGVTAEESVVEIVPGFFEVTISCLTVASRGLPWGGGGYFRLLPYPIFRRGAAQILESRGAYVFYLHPWEIDPGQPRVDGLPLTYRFRHYVGLGRCERRLASLLDDFSWTTVSDLLERRAPRAAAGRS